MAINYNKQNKKMQQLEQKILILENNIKNAEYKNDSFSNLKHEVARLNTSILTISEELHNKIDSEQNAKELRKFFKSIKDKINTIYHTSSMISSRMIYADLELNPSSLKQQMRFESNIYKKFDKARYILFDEAHKSRKEIKFNRNSYFTIRTISAFDCVPFILLNNAIKYSPQNTEITVSFYENYQQNIPLRVSIESFGPLVSENNLKKLITRGFRDENVLNTQLQGQGLGLYIANELCIIHGIKMSFSSVPKDYSMNINDAKYGLFTVTLDFYEP